MTGISDSNFVSPDQKKTNVNKSEYKMKTFSIVSVESS